MYAVTQRAPLCCRVIAAAERSLSSTQAKGSAAAAVGQRGVGIAAAAAVRRSVGGSETARAARWRQCGAAGWDLVYIQSSVLLLRIPRDSLIMVPALFSKQAAALSQAFFPFLLSSYILRRPQKCVAIFLKGLSTVRTENMNFIFFWPRSSAVY